MTTSTDPGAAAPKTPAAPATPSPEAPKAAPAEPAKPASAPQPTTASPPTPPTPPTPAGPTLSAAELQAEFQRLATARAEWERDRAEELATKRRDYVRGLGLSVALTDKQLDALVPQVDPRTDAGKAAIATWRASEEGARLFLTPSQAPAFDQGKFVEEMVGGQDNLGRRLFGARHAESFIADRSRSGWEG